jgi:hypothetical protein
MTVAPANAIPTMHTQRLTPIVKDRALALVLAVFAIIVASHFDVVPIWDAKIYYACIEAAVHKSFDLVNFRCVSHPSVGYALLLGITQYLAPWTPASMYVANAAIGIASILAFHGVIRLLFPNRPSGEYAFVAALYGLAPLFVANAVFLTLDYAATAFFVLFVYFVLVRRPWVAGGLGTVVAFTKETGGAAAALVMLAIIVAVVMKPPMSRGARIELLKAQLPIALVPTVGLALFVILLRGSREFTGWANTYATVGSIGWASRVDAWLNTNLADRTMQSFLFDMFGLNFQWLFTVVIVGAIAVRLARPSDHDPSHMYQPRLGLLAALSMIGLAYITTRYRGYNNARYVLLMSPVLVATFYGSLLWLVKNGAIRSFYLGLCAALVLISNFRTVDPLSKSIFGTFDFGSHRLLDMPSIVGGLRLDSLVYNLEFLQLEYLYAEMIRDLRPPVGAVILMGNAVYNFPPDVDGRSYTLTSNPNRAMPILVARGDIDRNILASHLTRDGDLFYYAAFANADNRELEALLSAYELVGRKRFDRYGYTLDLYTFRFRFTS